MVRANKRLPSSVNVSQSALDSVSSTLQGLPDKPKEKWSLREAVAVLQESISAALGKGYSYDEVAKMLSGKGIEISASSLKSYLSAAKRQKAPSVSKGKRTGRRTKKTQDNDVNVNGSAIALSELQLVASQPIAEPAKKTTGRKPKSEATAAKSAAKPARAAAKTKAAAKTSSGVAKPKAAKPTSRTRKKTS